MNIEGDGKGTTLLDDLMTLDPLLKQYNAVLSKDKEIKLDKKKLYGLQDLTSKDRRMLKFPGMASGMINVYSSDLQTRVYNSRTLHNLARILYGKSAIITPNRFRMQVPGVGGEENSHVDSNLGSDLKFGKDREYATILAINSNRPFEYLKRSHTKSFIDNLREHKYFKYNEDNHFINFHLEDKKTPDPLKLREQWARCYLRRVM